MPEINPLRITPPPGTSEASNPLAPDWMRNIGSAAADWMQRQHLQSQAMGLEDPATGLPTALGLRNALAQIPGALLTGTISPEFRAALKAEDFLGFDNAAQAVTAMRTHRDWQQRWDPQDPQKLQTLLDAHMQAITGSTRRPQDAEIIPFPGGSQ